jgi:TRAP-type mannitol/chloroaromatic compound transport system permease small subunit
MQALLKVSRLIDALNARVGRATYWLVLVAVLVSAGNAIIRKTMNMSSNAFLELQWYLFSAVFLLCAGYTLLRDEHVRRTRVWIDVLGTVFFLLPMALLFIYLSWPIFIRTYTTGEISTNAGGLLLWPARVLVPIGFTLLALQGISELIKRIGFLTGHLPDPQPGKEATDKGLAGDIRRIAEERP